MFFVFIVIVVAISIFLIIATTDDFKGFIYVNKDDTLDSEVFQELVNFVTSNEMNN